MGLEQEQATGLMQRLGPFHEGGGTEGHKEDWAISFNRAVHQQIIDTGSPYGHGDFYHPDTGSSELGNFQVRCNQHARALCDKLHDQEVQLHDSMPEHIRVVVKSKRILLKETGYDDLQVVDFMKHGVDLHGCHDLPPYAKSRVVPALS